jgi:hypothetical protein
MVAIEQSWSKAKQQLSKCDVQSKKLKGRQKLQGSLLPSSVHTITSSRKQYEHDYRK